MNFVANFTKKKIEIPADMKAAFNDAYKDLQQAGFDSVAEDSRSETLAGFGGSLYANAMFNDLFNNEILGENLGSRILDKHLQAYYEDSKFKDYLKAFMTDKKIKIEGRAYS